MFTKTARWSLGLAGALALIGVVAYAAAALSSLAPSSTQISGWTALEADKLAASASDLYKIYDGGDGPWKEAGVTSAFQRYYKNGATRHVLTLIIHRTGSSSQTAKALFNKKNPALHGQSGYKAVEVAEQASLATPSTGLSAHLCNKNYYVSITINGTSAADVSAAKSFLSAVSAKITKNG